MKLARLLECRTSSVPPLQVARAMGSAVRAEFESRLTVRNFMSDLLEAQGWTVRERTLEAERGGLQALMAPHDGGFLFVVDKAPTPDERLTWAGAHREWLESFVVNRRLAHELCHVFFYDTDGRRLLPYSDEEEAFCDEFAASFLPLGKQAGVPSVGNQRRVA